MTRLATNLNKQISDLRAVRRDRIWWSNAWESIKNVDDRVFFSPVLPDGTLITEVQIQARPTTDIWVCEGLMFLRIVGPGDLSNQQVYDSEPLIKWSRIEPRWDWGTIGKFTNERWPCQIRIKGAHRRLAWFSQALDDYGMRIRVSVQYEPV